MEEATLTLTLLLFGVGDSVRIRLTGDCNILVGRQHPAFAKGVLIPPHHPISDGSEGTIIDYDPEWGSHSWVVGFQIPGQRNMPVSARYALSELEPRPE